MSQMVDTVGLILFFIAWLIVVGVLILFAFHNIRSQSSRRTDHIPENKSAPLCGCHCHTHKEKHANNQPQGGWD